MNLTESLTGFVVGVGIAALMLWGQGCTLSSSEGQQEIQASQANQKDESRSIKWVSKRTRLVRNQRYWQEMKGTTEDKDIDFFMDYSPERLKKILSERLARIGSQKGTDSTGKTEELDISEKPSEDIDVQESSPWKKSALEDARKHQRKLWELFETSDVLPQSLAARFENMRGANRASEVYPVTRRWAGRFLNTTDSENLDRNQATALISTLHSWSDWFVAILAVSGHESLLRGAYWDHANSVTAGLSTNKNYRKAVVWQRDTSGRFVKSCGEFQKANRQKDTVDKVIDGSKWVLIPPIKLRDKVVNNLKKKEEGERSLPVNFDEDKGLLDIVETTNDITEWATVPYVKLGEKTKNIHEDDVALSEALQCYENAVGTQFPTEWNFLISEYIEAQDAFFDANKVLDKLIEKYSGEPANRRAKRILEDYQFHAKNYYRRLSVLVRGSIFDVPVRSLSWYWYLKFKKAALVIDDEKAMERAVKGFARTAFLFRYCALPGTTEFVTSLQRNIKEEYGKKDYEELKAEVKLQKNWYNMLEKVKEPKPKAAESITPR